MRHRSWAATLFALFVVTFAITLKVQPGGTDLTAHADNVVLLLSAAAAAAAGFWRGLRFSGRARHSWLLIAAGAASWAAGQAVWTYYESIADRPTPFPSPADAGYLGFGVLAAIGLLMRPSRAFFGRARRRVGLDSLLIATALFAVSWTTAFGEVFRGHSGSAFGSAISLAYPILDLLVLTVVVVVLSYARSGNRLGLLCIAAGLVAFAVADSGFAYLTAVGSYRTGSLIDAAWMAGFLVLALGALLDEAVDDDDAEDRMVIPRGALLLPYLPTAVGGAALLWRMHVAPEDVLAVGLAFALMLLLITRQVFVLLDNRRLLVRISHQARHDPLTGLANRALFMERLTHALELNRRDLREVTVLSIDLDDFKSVNDTLGHAAGDQLLVEIAERLRACVRRGDTPARMGGDEFAILIEDGGDGMDVAERILGILHVPVSVAGREFAVAASIGSATAGVADVTPTPVELLHRADVAMYAAKRSGKARACIYFAELADADLRQTSVRTVLAGDIAAGKITVAYQPIHLADGRLYGFEALARWRYGSEDVPPERFLPIAREVGCLPMLDRHVLTTALAEAATWDGERVITVNVDGETLAEAAFAEFVLSALRRTGVHPEQLAVEVHEAGVVDQNAPALRTLESLRHRGVRVAVDGFGCASFSGLRNLRPDIVKIDSSFTETHERAAATSLLDAVTRLAHQVGALVVAEGIERPSQLTAAEAAGCDAVQGFLLGTPGTPGESARVVREREHEVGVSAR